MPDSNSCPSPWKPLKTTPNSKSCPSLWNLCRNGARLVWGRSTDTQLPQTSQQARQERKWEIVVVARTTSNEPVGSMEKEIEIVIVEHTRQNEQAGSRGQICYRIHAHYQKRASRRNGKRNRNSRDVANTQYCKTTDSRFAPFFFSANQTKSK